MNKQKLHDLPEGYTPLEYISYRPPRRPELCSLTNFSSQEEADTILKICRDNNINIGTALINGVDAIIAERIIEKFLPDELKCKHSLAKAYYPISMNVYTPFVFRYMGSKYVDDFFNNGKLRISSFSSFEKHPHDNLKDIAEGRYKGCIAQGNTKIEMGMGLGANSFVLCGSLIASKDMITYFERYPSSSDPEEISILCKHSCKNNYCKKIFEML